MRLLKENGIRLTLASCCALAASAACAAPPPGWTAVDAAQLSEMRGGFTTDTGLKISFGVERTVSVNGDLMSTVGFSADDLGKLVSGQTPAVTTQGATELIQNGAGNLFQPGQLAASTAATFIQNSLNDQTIRSVTVVNAATNSLEFLKGINLQSSLNEALTNAAVAH